METENDFNITNGILTRYKGTEKNVVIPHSVRYIT